MSIASAIENAQAKVASAYSACNEKGATMPTAANQNLSNLATTIGTISAGGGAVAEKGVNFRDYDGTLVASYTAAEFANLSALPANPSHAGLTAQGWNWTLSDAKTYVATYGFLEIGQMYVTSDGKTRLYISIDRPEVLLYFSQAEANAVSVDWGDDSPAYTNSSGSGTCEATHTYDTVGDYVISFTVNSGTLSLGGANNIFKSLDKYRGILKKVEIGSSVRISSYAFQYCNSLSSITIPSSDTPHGSFSSLGDRAFMGCYSLKSLTVPNWVTSLGQWFVGTNEMMSYVSLPNGVTSIPTYAFYMTALSTITIPSSVTSFGNCAFMSSSILSKIIVPSGVTSIGNSAFSSCTALSTITIPSGVTSIGSSAFYNNRNLKELTIPSLVTSIGESMCSGCSALESVSLLGNIQSIPKKAFWQCYSLRTINIPSSVTSIGDEAFYQCYNIASFTLPSGVTSIGNKAFQQCTNLKSLYIEASAPPTLGTDVFKDASTDFTIYVPSASVATYKAASGWSDYADKIQAMPQ